MKKKTELLESILSVINSNPIPIQAIADTLSISYNRASRYLDALNLEGKIVCELKSGIKMYKLKGESS